MRSNLMCILTSAAGAVGWWWISKSLFVTGLALVLGLWSSLRASKEERTAWLLMASPVVPGYLAALLTSVLPSSLRP
jgi:hypothetical protein